MNITWKDGVTTLSTASAIVLERAFFHDWDWPLITSMRWTVIGLTVLIAVGFLFSYVLDAVRGTVWSWVAGGIGVITLTLAGLGLYFNTNTDFVVLLMLSAVLFWAASLVRHITVHYPVTRSHA